MRLIAIALNRYCLTVASLCLLFALSPASECSGEEQSIDLAGTWRFKLDPADSGMTETWFASDLPDEIELPGSLQERGFGNDVTIDTKWTGSIIDQSWYESDRYAPYRQPGNVKVPFWLQPVKHYVGAAWYQRDLVIPRSWDEQRIVLFLERPHWQTRVWIDETEISTHDSLSTPHVHDLTDALSPGRHRLTIRVDNRMIVDVGHNAHSVSDHTQSNWNGLVGRLELHTTSPVWIDDIQVFPNEVERTAAVRITMGNRTGTSGSGDLILFAARPGHRTEAKMVPIEWDGAESRLETIELPMGPDARLWDEFQPDLYTLTVSFRSAHPTLGALDHERAVTFGLRTFAVDGTQFTINNRKTFLRGTLECCVFPLTGYPPTDKDSWLRILRICHAHGLNHMRFHSWCPPEAAFAAADELGVYLQAECAAWARIGMGEPIDTWLHTEAERIVRAYGNHPSFVLMAYGNEPSGKHQEFLSRWVDHWRKNDSRRVYTSAAGWPEIDQNEYHNIPAPRIQGWGQGLGSRINAERPETYTDYAGHVQRAGRPIVSHEIGQWCVYPDFDEIDRYTGVLKAKNFEIFKDFLGANHMGPQARSFLLASGKLQVLCYKEEVESALRTSGFGGFQLLQLNDFPGQGTALVGMLDPFWNSKSYMTPEEFNRFCAPTVLLARLSRRLFAESDTLTAEIEIAHFGPEPLGPTPVIWKILSDQGEVLSAGTLPAREVPIGNGIAFGRIETPCADLARPARYTLLVSLAGTKIENDWNYWVYASKLDPTNEGVLIVDHLDEAAATSLAAGGKVLLLPPAACVKTDAVVGFSSVFWNTAWTRGQAPHTLGILCDPEHPVFAAFPTDYHTDWQWWELIHDAAAMTLDAMPPALRPLVQPIDTWFEARRLGLLFEARVGKGKLMVCTMDLKSKLDQRLAARQMRHSILAYMNSDRFDPTETLSIDDVTSLFRPLSTLQKLGATVTADSAAPGHEALDAIDQNPDTIWHTSWDPSPEPHPHEFVIELEKSLPIDGLSVLPRQDMANGRIARFEVYVSDSTGDWGRPAVIGTWANGSTLQKALFGRPVTGRYVKLVALSEVNGNPYTSIAEIDLLVAN